MLSLATVAEIRRLVREGSLTRLEIARRMGVCRATVTRIVRGKRPDIRPEGRLLWDEPAGPVRRCPECGGLVHMPCRLCLVRRLAAAVGKPASLGDDDPLRLELRPRHRRRYEEVLARRAARAD